MGSRAILGGLPLRRVGEFLGQLVSKLDILDLRFEVLRFVVIFISLINRGERGRCYEAGCDDRSISTERGSTHRGLS